jgi:tubulin-specific chaperone E
MEISNVKIGMRVSDLDGNYATVRYIGSVASSKVKTDVWIGVEWDDKERGKHDGSCLDDAGVFHRYFECTFGAGSFIKVHKLAHSCSFLDALYQKYKDDSSTSNLADNYALTAKGNQKPIQFVGEENIRKWQQLNLIKQVTLPKMAIATAGDHIKDIAGHFTYIDVQYNLFYTWIEIAKLSLQIPSLEALYILGNKMESLTHEVVLALPHDSFAHIKTLCISKCNIHSWSAIETLHSLTPNIHDIFATHSKFEDMPVYDTISHTTISSPFLHLKRLDVSSCGISEWGQILSLGKLPALIEVLADDNPIPKITSCPDGFFKTITRFSLNAIL